MKERVDVAIVGAGPYGLSLAAHLRASGVDFRIFGKPMDNWRNFMPPGMMLKSQPWSSDIYDPQKALPLSKYCAEKGIAYHDSLMPLPVETFVAYGDAFQRRMVPNVEAKFVRRLSREGEAYRLEFDEGSDVIARRVVIAVGVHPFRNVPQECAGLPAELLTHSADHGKLDAFVGKDVVVLGAGASASGLAALLHERGARVSLVTRSDSLHFAEPPRPKSRLRKLAAPLRAVLAPESGIGRGWKLRMWSNQPWSFHSLPEGMRRKLIETTLGPSGHSLMRDRVLGKVPLHLGQSLLECRERAGRAELTMVGEDGVCRTLAADHVIAATGYRIDLAKLPFLDPSLLASIALANGDPILSSDYETSAPGFHVVGPASALSFGPVSRFVFGAIHPARSLVSQLSASHHAVDAELATANWEAAR